MSTSTGSFTAPIPAAKPVTDVAAVRVPWTVWACVSASISIAIGLYWDISWHETIGRDSFWTPAHLLIQLGGLLTALVCAMTIFSATFQPNSAARTSSVNVLGFRGPLGAFIAAWGGLAMVTSAPFDNWWHDAYGLDVKILSPPHILLAIGIAGIVWGGLLLTVAEMNRAEGPQRIRLQRLCLLLGGFVVVHSMILRLEYTNKVLLHSSLAYIALSVGLLLVLEAPARAARHRWARTIMTGIYSLFTILMLWILPLFPASPKLGPVYQNITHMVPLPWPILLVVPAFVLDLMWPIFEKAPLWQQALFGGVAFMTVLVAVQWPFATFLMSPAARNWFFHPANYPYFTPPNAATVRYVFVKFDDSAAQFWRGMGLAFAFSVVSLWVGIIFGNWLKRIQR
jgi:hypothetical protein